MRAWLIELFDAYAAHTGRTKLTISVRICGGAGDFYEALQDENRTFEAYAFDRTVGALSDAWPKNLPWPKGCPRFSREDVRAKARRKSPRIAAE